MRSRRSKSRSLNGLPRSLPRGGASLSSRTGSLRDGKPPRSELLEPKPPRSGGRESSNCDLGPRGASGPPPRPGLKILAADCLLSENRGGERDLSRGPRYSGGGYRDINRRAYRQNPCGCCFDVSSKRHKRKPLPTWRFPFGTPINRIAILDFADTRIRSQGRLSGLRQ